MLSIGPTVTFFSGMKETDAIIDGRAYILVLHVILFLYFSWLRGTKH